MEWVDKHIPELICIAFFIGLLITCWFVVRYGE